MTRWKILVADELGAEGVEILRAAGDVVEKRGLKPDALAKELPPYHALVVRSATLVDARALEGAERLAVIGRAGIGVDNIDLAAATARGITVMNTPESGAVTTGELAIAHLFALARKIPEADALMKAGRWEKSKLTGVEVTGKTLGLIGLGRIGRVVADRALGLKMRVLAYDPFVTQEKAPAGVVMAPFDRTLAEADFVSVHAPLMDDTRHLLDEKAFALMKPGARLIHCARGGIVKESALVEALQSGRLAGAAVDVFEQEPPGADHPLLKAPNVVLTPHLGASTEEAKRAVGVDLAKQIVQLLRHGVTVNGVNVPHIAPADAEFLAPFLSLAERLASLLVQLHPGAVRAIRVRTQGEIGERSQRPLVVSALVGALRHVASGPTTPVNAERLAKEAGIDVSTERTTLKKDFVNLVRVELDVDGVVHAASGTLIGRRHLRMVELDEFLIDAIPEGRLLVTYHDDRPGVLGAIGTLLGEAAVNISRLQLGVTHERDGRAVGVFNLDQDPPAATLDRVRAVPGIRRLASVGL
ncbi:MAG TPA: phosphoglycerate dehydrogenase [Planctomycetota bacterium]|nr:phosphoglycerate dehydrogenase [Planctomycetota bacterium]